MQRRRADKVYCEADMPLNSVEIGLEDMRSSINKIA
jgi:hypothetical protein